MSGNMGAWDSHYAKLTKPEAYGGNLSYEIAAFWTKDCTTVEDWGCGKGWLRNFIEPERYIGIDGSTSPFADVVADLVTYRSSVEGIVLRGVLEHNYEWAIILKNALESATKRLSVILFTPLVAETHVLLTEPDYNDVPVIAFKLTDLTDLIWERKYEIFTFDSATFYGTETVINIQ